MIKLERYLPHLVSLSLLVLAAIFKSAAFAYASVIGVLGIMTHSLIVERLAALQVKTGLPEEAKRLIHDLSARVTTIEYGIKTRGF